MSAYDLAIFPYISICTEEMKAYIHTMTCTHVFLQLLIENLETGNKLNGHQPVNG